MASARRRDEPRALVDEGSGRLGHDSHRLDQTRDLVLNCKQEDIMGTPAENLIATFEQLPDMEKQEVASAILRRTLQIEFPPVSDEELVLGAEATFLELDRREAEDAQS